MNPHLCDVSLQSMISDGFPNLLVFHSSKQCFSPYCFLEPAFPSIYKNSLGMQLTFVPIHFSVSFKCWITRALFPLYAFHKFQMPIPYSKNKCIFFCFSFLQAPCSHSTSIFVKPFCTTTYLLRQVPSLKWGNCPAFTHIW